MHIINESVSVKDGHITYKEKDMSDVEKKIYQSYAEGLIMRN